MTLMKKGKCSKCGWICCQGCEHLTSEGLCGIFETRPEGCRVYPHSPLALEKGCTFYFIDTETEDVITGENAHLFPKQKRNSWIEVFIERSEDE